MKDWKETALCEIFGCGRDDLRLLAGVNYDMGFVIEWCMDRYSSTNINDIMRYVFYMGVEYIKQAIEDELDETEDEEEIEALKKLDPDKDIMYVCNCLDTRVWFRDAEKTNIYTEYLQDALDEFHVCTGFEITY